MSPIPRPARLVRRVASLTAVLGVLLSAGLCLAGPASADPAEGWPVAPAVDPWFVLGVMVGGTLVLTLLIAAFVYLPAMVRGERVAPGAPPLEDQWLGGRRTAGELSAAEPPPQPQAPAEIESSTGGAGGRW